jgi:hypothetical protein
VCACDGVACAETKTCSGGACVSATIYDPGACRSGSGCDEGSLGGPDGGAEGGRDSGAEGGSDAFVDVAIDAPVGDGSIACLVKMGSAENTLRGYAQSIAYAVAAATYTDGTAEIFRLESCP